MTLYVKVIDAKCCGYTRCADVCPEVFALDSDGFVEARMTEVPTDLADKAREGARVCPEGAIEVSDAPFE